MPTIVATDREGRAHTVQAKAGLSVMENLRDLGNLDIAAVCGGCCSCATCHVYVDPAWMDRIPPQETMELELVGESRFYQENSRLSCQIPFTPALDGLTVTLAPED
jgi:2Fe-2S ferredoxin